MDISKIKLGKFYNWITRNSTGRGKAVEIVDTTRGAWVKLIEKGTGRELSFRAGNLYV